MSLILEALRKIELERKARRQSSQEIRREVLNYHGTTPSAEKSRIIPATAALLLVSASAACFFYFLRPEPPKTESMAQKQTFQQEPVPITQPQPLPLPPSRQPTQMSPTADAEKTPGTVKTPAKVIINNQTGDEISVSGIAWQDEHSLRRAVINGMLVGEGAEIKGAKIVEIKENRVRFSRDGEIFEVIHSSGAGK